MKLFLSLIAIFIYITASAQPVILINNAQIFNGKDEKLIVANLLVEGNIILKISASPIPVNKSANTVIIDATGKTLMPGLIDAHAHLLMESVTMPELITSDLGYATAVAVASAEKDLMQGFTTFRDLAGPSFGLKSAIDRGIVKGPRVYPSGAMISQTSGHGDFLMPYEVPRDAAAPLTYAERNNFGIIADGVDEVTKRVREQLRLGATQIKLAAGGGISSNFDPIDVTQYTYAEMKAAADAAENWGTYLAVHAYTPKAIQTALQAGAKCIEHGQLMDESTAKMIRDKDAWLCLQPFIDDGVSVHAEGSPRRLKQKKMQAGTDSAYFYAKKYKLKTAFGTDVLWSRQRATNRAKELVRLVRWYTPFEVLKMATSTNAELLAMSGERNPYPGKLGVIEEGAYADILLVNGNPLKDINLLTDPNKNLLLIMKDGVIYKNQVGQKSE